MNRITIVLLIIILLIIVYMHLRLNRLLPGSVFPSFTIDLSAFSDFSNMVATSFGGLSNGGYQTVTGDGYYALTPVGYDPTNNSFQDILITIYLTSPPTNPVISLKFSDFTPIQLQYGPSIPLQLGSLNNEYTYNTPNGIYSYNLTNVQTFVQNLNAARIPFYTVIDLGQFNDFNNFLHNPAGSTQPIANTITTNEIPVTLKLGSYLTNAVKSGDNYIWNNFTATVNGVDYNMQDYFTNLQITWNLSGLTNPDTNLKQANLPITITYSAYVQTGNIVIRGMDTFSQNLANTVTWVSSPITGIDDSSVERSGTDPLATGCLYAYCAYTNCSGDCRDAEGDEALNCIARCPTYQGCDNLFRTSYINSNFIAALNSPALNGTC